MELTKLTWGVRKIIDHVTALAIAFSAFRHFIAAQGHDPGGIRPPTSSQDWRSWQQPVDPDTSREVTPLVNQEAGRPRTWRGGVLDVREFASKHSGATLARAPTCTAEVQVREQPTTGVHRR